MVKLWNSADFERIRCAKETIRGRDKSWRKSIKLPAWLGAKES